MTDERAMEILDPNHREHYDSIEPVNQACLIGIKAIKKVAKLNAEIKKLKAKLDKSMELPCKMGDPFYTLIEENPGRIKIKEHICCGFEFKNENKEFNLIDENGDCYKVNDEKGMFEVFLSMSDAKSHIKLIKTSRNKNKCI